MVACGILGFGAAMLVAALLLSTYTASRITKIPLDIDTTLVSNGTALALDPASLSTDRFVANNNVPVVQQQQYNTESGMETPSNADLVTLQVGTTLRRTDKQQETGLLLAIVDTVIPASNTRDDSPNNRYAIDPMELQAIDLEARKRKMGVVGIYHSHPDVAARPSEFDREHACPWYCYAIVSIVKGQSQELLNWKLDDNDKFVEDPILT